MLSVLVLHWDRRRDKLAELLEVLLPQAERVFPLVEIVALRNGGGELARLREQLLWSARGSWLCYVDDDDLVPDYYVDEIIGLLTLRPELDYVGFLVERAWDSIWGVHGGVSSHSLSNEGWTTSTADYCHLNPVRTAIARQCTYMVHTGSGPGEDRVFRDQILPRLRGRPTADINRVMYHYRWRLDDSVQCLCAHRIPSECAQVGHPFPYWRHASFTVPPRLEVSSPVFRWHEGSSS